MTWEALPVTVEEQANQNLAGLVPQLASAQEGILITRIRFDQTRAEFERQVNNLVASVEFAQIVFNEYGFAPNFRRYAEAGRLVCLDHT